jgi:hypothetical protein
MIKKINQTVTFLVLVLTLVFCANGNPEHEFDITGNWVEKNGESTLELTKEGGYAINFKPSLSDGSTKFSSKSYDRIDNSHFSFTIIMGRASFDLIDVKVSIKSSDELRFKLDGKTYRFIKADE